MSSSLGGYTGLRGPTGVSGSKIPSGYKLGQLQQFTPEQMQLYQQLFSHVSPQSYLGRLAGGDEEAFKQTESPALREFASQMGGLASRFSGMGLGARRSSGFQNTSSAAASNLAQDLAAKRQELQRQALSDLMGISHNLLSQKPYEQFLYEKQQKPSGFSKYAGLAGGALGALGGGILGGPAGALSGAQFGLGIGSALSGLGGGGSNSSFSSLGLPTSWNSLFGKSSSPSSGASFYDQMLRMNPEMLLG